jgi:uncharacterized protein (TIGR03435 family)
VHNSQGLYDFNLAWVPQPATSDVAAGPTIFDDLEKQFRLKLENQKRPMPTIVIEHAERVSTEN